MYMYIYETSSFGVLHA